MKVKIHLMQTEENECNYPGYQPVEAEMELGTDGEAEYKIYNRDVITFAEMTPLRNIVTQVAIANSDGGTLMWAPLTIPLHVTPGMAPAFQPGSLRWSDRCRRALWNRKRRRTI